MKTSTLSVTLTLILTLFIVSCKSLIEPKTAETIEVKGSVYYLVGRQKFYEEYEEVMSNPLTGSIVSAFNFTGEVPTYKCKLSESERAENTSMVEWVVNQDEIGDEYTGYLIIYRVNYKGEYYYALCDLVEFANDRYEVNLIALENTLSEAKSYIID